MCYMLHITVRFVFAFMISDMQSVLSQLQRYAAYVSGIRITRNWTEKLKIKRGISQNRTVNSSWKLLFSVVKLAVLMLGSMSLMMKWKCLLEILSSSEIRACVHLFYNADNEFRPSNQWTNEEMVTPYNICFLVHTLTIQTFCSIYTKQCWSRQNRDPMLFSVL